MPGVSQMHLSKLQGSPLPLLCVFAEVIIGMGLKRLFLFCPQEVTGYQSKTWKIILCHFFSLLTLGIPLIVFHWKPHFKVRAKCSRCPLHQADWVVIRVSGIGGWRGEKAGERRGGAMEQVCRHTFAICTPNVTFSEMTKCAGYRGIKYMNPHGLKCGG